MMDTKNVLEALDSCLMEHMEKAFAAGIEQGKESAPTSGPTPDQLLEALGHAYRLGIAHVVDQLRDATIHVEEESNVDSYSGGLSGTIYFERSIDLDDHLDLDDYSSEISAEQIAECTEAFAPKTETETQPQN